MGWGRREIPEKIEKPRLKAIMDGVLHEYLHGEGRHGKGPNGGSDRSLGPVGCAAQVAVEELGRER